MAVEQCCVCDRLVDLDECVEGIVYIDGNPYCPECVDLDELIETYEAVHSRLDRAEKALREIIETKPFNADGHYERAWNNALFTCQDLARQGLEATNDRKEISIF